MLIAVQGALPVTVFSPLLRLRLTAPKPGCTSLDVDLDADATLASLNARLNESGLAHINMVPRSQGSSLHIAWEPVVKDRWSLYATFHGLQ
ncbi:hypothetical protein PF005_g4225 [Phytophthora fragariae]|uniref:Uncharacterized protein n=2 Tax=Phytophthora TaxID=4783 RepID=A0A6A3T869_9STRA|nr:hypothetical protein PF009_g4783 [Phytophthora fragariae]KAE8971536.1 hypothetical protein PR001_g26857 [Phytophthora rubi]KAE9025523.1 hypothetical protein PF011_g2979 [Phytophthora fragariae]KAE9042446.1 hypothetical protein PR002_g3903 [Phytophthora rubi]KAE9130729.1 hypothetical protein PF010_g3740 [Phytophthora fragariae]